MSGISSGGSFGGGEMMLSVPSSFGEENTTFGPPGFYSLKFLRSPRAVMLARRSSYFKCTQHDHKSFDFDSRMIQPGPPTSQPMLSSEASPFYVPLKMRRPSAPYRLARVIVKRFTNMMFGYRRWPKIKVHGDVETEDFVNALVKQSKLRTLMVQARNMGGSCGTVGISWRIQSGKASCSVHNAKNLFVHEWANRDEKIPRHVSEIYLYPKEKWNAEKSRWEVVQMWFRQDWTEDADIAFFPVEMTDQEPVFQVDEENSRSHSSGECRLVWIQNLPDDEGTEIDGQPDYAEVYETFDSMDTLNSVVMRGASLNLDPTLVLSMDPDVLDHQGVSKGSDNSLAVGEGGSASYLELGGSSITTGIALFDKQRETTLEAAGCVIPDPNTIGAAGMSSVALKVIYEPMLSQCEVLREQYGDGLVRLITQMLQGARTALNDVSIEIDSDSGQVTEVKPYLDLPPRFDEQIDPEGNILLVPIERRPGDTDGHLELVWPDYFSPTADDQQKNVVTITTAVTGGVLSPRSGSEEVAEALGLDPKREWVRLQEVNEQTATESDAMFSDPAGEIPLEDLPGPTETIEREIKAATEPEAPTAGKTATGAPPAVPES